jgi:hypothetical protein
VISLGLLGELIIFTHAPEMKEYKIAEIVQAPAEANEPDSGDAASVKSDSPAASAVR